MVDFVGATTLMLALLNPFLVIVYLLDLVEKLDFASFAKVIVRAGLISSVVFCSFAVLGDRIFTDLMRAHFASFQLFGGVVFLLIGIQFVFQGSAAIQILRGDSEHLAGAIAMPVLIGPGTISASVLVGQRLSPVLSCLAIVLAVVLSLASMVVMKRLHDWVRPRHERLVQRYIEVAGRITALFVGTYAVEMIMTGALTWFSKG